MNDSLKSFLTKKNIISALALALLILAVPLSVYLVQQTQIFKPKAAEERIGISGNGVFDCVDSGCKTTSPTVNITFHSPFGPYGVPVSVTPTATTNPTGTPSPTATATTAPISPSPIPGLSASISGTNGSYSATATGTNLRKVLIYAAKTTADLSQAGSWTLVAENANCAGFSPCSVSGVFSPSASGDYYVVVNAQMNNGNPFCSGSPANTGTPRCGPNDSVILTVR